MEGPAPVQHLVVPQKGKLLPVFTCSLVLTNLSGCSTRRPQDGNPDVPDPGQDVIDISSDSEPETGDKKPKLEPGSKKRYRFLPIIHPPKSDSRVRRKSSRFMMTLMTNSELSRRRRTVRPNRWPFRLFQPHPQFNPKSPASRSRRFIHPLQRSSLSPISQQSWRLMSRQGISMGGT